MIFIGGICKVFQKWVVGDTLVEVVVFVVVLGAHEFIFHVLEPTIDNIGVSVIYGRVWIGWDTME